MVNRRRPVTASRALSSRGVQAIEQDPRQTPKMQRPAGWRRHDVEFSGHRPSDHGKNALGNGMAARIESRQPVDVAALARGIRAGERALLARAITLIESRRPDHQRLARQLVQEVLPSTGNAVRVGITGAPGVGKSTTIDALGIHLTAKGHRIAVLTVDPSSRRTGGSILGDKTRMPRLAADPAAFIRPSPASGTLGGVAGKTREAMLLCEAAGYDVVLVETVGTGQSETVVADMTDFFLVLMLPGAGDELQALKKGVIELADMIAVNKADGENVRRATAAAAEYRAALHILAPRSPNWTPPVLTYSALTGKGIDELWTQITRHRERLTRSGEFAQRRREQQVRWMWAMVEERLLGRLRSDPAVKARLPELEEAVAAGRLAPALAADEIARAMGA
jgi:LAO/AO transport system kinase